MNDHELWRRFGDDWPRARDMFFDVHRQRADGTYPPQERCSTQRAAKSIIDEQIAQVQAVLK